MSAEVVTFPLMSEAEAERVTEQIAFRIDSITENYEVVMSLMRDALARNAHEALGYASPGAYIADRFGRSLQTLGASLRREFVHELSDAGLSTRAIAPVFDVSHMTVSNDLKAGVKLFTPEPAPVEVDRITADPRTGEVIEEPTVTEHTVTEKVKTTTGLDGKQYKRAEPSAPSAPRRRSLVDEAHTASKELFLAVERIRTITTDDRYTRNKADILTALQSSIDLALETLPGLANTIER